MKRHIVLKPGQRLWFTADTHYSHANFVLGESQWTDKSKTRPFQTTQEMNDFLVSNINRLVAEDDVLYHLGDFAFRSAEEVEKFRSRINCKNLHLILGNHDHRIEESEHLRSLFSTVDYYVELTVNGEHTESHLVLMHYPLSSWNRMHRGSIHLHGHLHSPPYDRQWEGRMDVGVDGNGMCPIEWSKVVGLF